MKTKKRAKNGGDRLGSENHFNAASYENDLLSENTVLEQELQAKILSHTNQKPRKVVKLFPCYTCVKSYVPEKMAHVGACKKCVHSAQLKSPSEKRRFFASAVNGYMKFMRGAIAL